MFWPGFNLTRKQQLVLYVLVFIIVLVVFVTYPFFIPRDLTNDIMLIIVAVIGADSFAAAYRRPKD